MNIEEKAKEYRSNAFRTPFGNDIAMSFSEGAKWMLEKACEYIYDGEGNGVGHPVKRQYSKSELS